MSGFKFISIGNLSLSCFLSYFSPSKVTVTEIGRLYVLSRKWAVSCYAVFRQFYDLHIFRTFPEKLLFGVAASGAVGLRNNKNQFISSQTFWYSS